MPVIDQVPSEPIVVVWAVVEFVPSVTTTEIEAFASPVPLIDVLSTFDRLIGFVTDVMAIVDLVLVWVA